MHPLRMMVIVARNAVRCNDREDLASLSFILKLLVFSEAYLEPSRTSMVKPFAKIVESRGLFLQKKLHHRCLIEF